MRPYFTNKDLDVLESWWNALCCLQLISFDELNNIQQDLCDIAFEMDERDEAECEWEEWLWEMDDELDDEDL